MPGVPWNRKGDDPSRRRVGRAAWPVTYFVALPFIRVDNGTLVAGEAQERPTAGLGHRPVPWPSREQAIRRRAISAMP